MHKEDPRLQRQYVRPHPALTQWAASSARGCLHLDVFLLCLHATSFSEGDSRKQSILYINEGCDGNAGRGSRSHSGSVPFPALRHCRKVVARRLAVSGGVGSQSGDHGIPSSSGQPRATLTVFPIKNARPNLSWKCQEPILRKRMPGCERRSRHWEQVCLPL